VVPAISVFATVRVSPAAYPLPAVVTVTPVTVPEPPPPSSTTIVKTAPEPPPFDVVPKPVTVPDVASVGFVVMLDVCSVPRAKTNPLQY